MNTNWNDPNFQGFRGQNPFHREGHTPKSRKAVGTPFGRTVLNLAVTLVFAAAYFYVVLPPINLKAPEFYVFTLLVCGVYGLCAVMTSGFQGDGVKGYFKFLKKQCLIPLALAILLVVTALVGSAVGWQVFRAGSYRDLLTVENGDFAAEVEEISFDQIPMLDKDSAAKLGNRKLGELADMVSQFEVADNYTQINYKGRPVRVTTLQYGDIIKWLNNRSAGLPAYLIIDMVTQNVEVVRLEEGIRYTPAEHFGRNLYRYLRFHYPTYLFDEPAFEIDEEGRPWWVCPRIDRTIGLFGGTDITGAALVNAVTGETAYYDVADIPTWVDHVYTADLIIQQYDYHGTYINGFWNSLFGQREVTVTTEGYNYIAIGDDVYMYTGITSVVSDESNVGFILSNQRTKETRFYAVAIKVVAGKQKPHGGRERQQAVRTVGGKTLVTGIRTHAPRQVFRVRERVQAHPFVAHAQNLGPQLDVLKRSRLREREGKVPFQQARTIRRTRDLVPREADKGQETRIVQNTLELFRRLQEFCRRFPVYLFGNDVAPAEGREV